MSKQSTKEVSSRQTERRPDDEERGLTDPTAPSSRRTWVQTQNAEDYLRALRSGTLLEAEGRPDDEERGLTRPGEGAQRSLGESGPITLPSIQEQSFEGLENALSYGLGGARAHLTEITPEDDRAAAANERASQITIENEPTSSLVRIANTKNNSLFHPINRMGPCQRATIAEYLLRIHDTLTARINAAPRDTRTSVPIVEGLQWDPDDPLERDLEAIPPFSMHDPWGVIYSQAPEYCAQPRRRGTRTCEIEAVASWYAERPPTESLFAPIPPGRRIFLNASSSQDTCNRRLTYEWLMNYRMRPDLSRRTIQNPTSINRAYLDPDQPGVYTVILKVNARNTVPVTHTIYIHIGRSMREDDDDDGEDDDSNQPQPSLPEAEDPGPGAIVPILWLLSDIDLPFIAARQVFAFQEEYLDEAFRRGWWEAVFHHTPPPLNPRRAQSTAVSRGVERAYRNGRNRGHAIARGIRNEIWRLTYQRHTDRALSPDRQDALRRIANDPVQRGRVVDAVLRARYPYNSPAFLRLFRRSN